MSAAPVLDGGSGAAGAAEKRSRGRSQKSEIGRRERLEIAVLSGPAILLFLFFVIFPVLMAGYYGFFKWKGYGVPTDFVGLKNYITILTDPEFHAVLGHNAIILVASLLLQGPIALLLALLLNKKMRGQSIIRVLIFIPYVISEVIAGTAWSLLLQSQGGVNRLLTDIGLGAFTRDWIADPKIAMATLMFILTWKYVGFAVIIFLAGLQGIPTELMEAAKVDGASYWQIQRRITIPLLGPTLRMWAFLSIIGSLQLFDLVYIIWGQYIASTAGTSTMASYMVINGRLAGNYGYGNAVAVVVFFISLIIALAYQRFVLRRDTEGALTGGRK
ncbi:sugar ABC transporter permease [Schaalia hyovaginalis]|uniref:carbohydrate ABC transporter permease n=1 Tax=Schaalia hyovaginalis TaxID=29316 RepID=UPI002A761030|nr:sugar ABC transporter permease [Schaalia hyovaginalis]MDY2669066.1 sugar ABC transporter permease [Schaalia hyovaginalis]